MDVLRGQIIDTEFCSVVQVSPLELPVRRAQSLANSWGQVEVSGDHLAWDAGLVVDLECSHTRVVTVPRSHACTDYHVVEQGVVRLCRSSRVQNVPISVVAHAGEVVVATDLHDDLVFVGLD